MLTKQFNCIIVILIVFLSVIVSVSAIWIDPSVDIQAGSFTLNTKALQNFSYLAIDANYTNLSWDGATFHNITYVTNVSSSRDIIELNGVCDLGNYTTDISFDVYAPSDWTVTPITIAWSNSSEQDIFSTSGSQFNTTHRRFTGTYNPDNDLTGMGWFSVNISISASNDTLEYNGYNFTDSLFQVYDLPPVSNVTSEYNTTFDSVNFTWSGVGEEIYYFNSSGANEWAINPSNLIDDDPETFARPGEVTFVYNLDENTCPGVDLGDIYSVALRMYAYDTGDTVTITPSYDDGAGDGNVFNPAINPAWSSWYDVTTDTNAPSPWSWNNISDMNVTLTASGINIWGGMVELRVQQYGDIGNTSIDRYVVVRSNDSYPDCPTDGDIVQNSTSTSYGIAHNFNESYFCVFSYNATTHSFSSPVRMPWGAIQFQCFNESNTTQAINFNIEITDEEATQVYTAYDVSNGHIISFSDIPYGEDTIIVISNSSYKIRTYYKDLYISNFYNFTFYLPPHTIPGGEGGGGSSEDENDTHLYYIKIIDAASNALPDANVVVKRYINATESYAEIGSMITGGYGYCSIYLIPNTLYKVFVNKTGYENKTDNWITDPENYGLGNPLIIQISPLSPNFPEATTYDEAITFDGYMTHAGIIFVNYTDSLNATISTNIRVFELVSDTTLYWDNRTSDSNFSFWVAGANTSLIHRVTLDLHHTTFGSMSPADYFDVGGFFRNLTSAAFFNALFITNYGTSPGGFGWSNIFGMFVLIVGLFAFGQRNSGVALLITGGLLAFINTIIGINLMGATIPALFVVMGVLVQWRNHRKESPR